MNTLPHVKTPVTILQELVVKRGWPPPEYNLTDQQVGCVKTEFKFELEMSGVIAIGIGKSKMNAKHETARNMLLHLEEDGLYTPPSHIKRMLLASAHASVTNYADEEEDKSSSSAMDSVVDYVGLLSANCSNFYMEQPKYELVRTMGPPHAREFTYICTLLRKKVVVIGSKKKIAKQLAAEKMWSLYKSVFDVVQDLPIRPHLGVSVLNYETGFLEHAKEKHITDERLTELFAPPFTEDNLKAAFAELELTYELESFLTSETEKIYICNANACIDLCSYGRGQTDEEAKANAVEQFYYTLYKYLDYDLI